MPKTRLAILLALCLVTPDAVHSSVLELVKPDDVRAKLDDLGNYAGQRGYLSHGEGSAPTEICGVCKEPGAFVWGVAFRNDEKWVVDLRRKLYRLDGCEATAISLGLTTLPAGLGYDTQRDLFILTDAALDVVLQIHASGRITNSWPTPGPGPVGTAYDSRRDLYWISDWEQNRLYSVDPRTGLPGPAMDVPGGSRIAGTAYDAALDALVYHSRDEALTYWVSIETGQVLATFDIPQGGRNNGQGAAVDPNAGDLWLTHKEDPRLFCVRGLSTMSVAGKDNSRRERRFEELTRGAEPPGIAAPVLHAASPNPFNPVTRIRYSLPTESFADLSIFDVRGRLVETLVADTQTAGEHVVEWRASGAASGIYFYRPTVGANSQTRKVIILK